MAYHVPVFLEQLPNGIYQIRMQDRVFGVTNGTKKKTNARVARLNRNKTPGVSDPNGKGLGSDFIKITDVMEAPPKEPRPGDLEVECESEVGENCINFMLNPGTTRALCHFNIPYRIDPTAFSIVLYLDTTQFVSFIINDTPFCFQGEALDITKQTNEGENKLTFNTVTLRENIVASVQWRMGSGLDPTERAEQTLSLAEEMEMDINGEFVQDNDPVTHLPITLAARGANCSHAQAFDARTYLERGYASGEWKCPVCGSRVEPKDLRVDRSYLKQCGTVFLEDEFQYNDPFDFY